MDTSLVNTYHQHNRSKVHPQKFALILACASMMMLFMALTSAYIVRQAAGNWLEFEFPTLFYTSTFVILLSSIILHSSYLGFKSGREGLYKTGLVLTTILGLVFIVLQYRAWTAMLGMDIPLGTNPSGDFVYVISGVHAAHVIGGIGVLVVALVHAFALPFKFTPKRKLRFELTLIYWHFVDLLWIYLLVFFLLQR